MQTTNVHEFVHQFSQYLTILKNGEEILIEDDGKPIAKMVPFESAQLKQRQFGILPELEMSGDFDAPLPDDFAFPFGKADE